MDWSSTLLHMFNPFLVFIVLSQNANQQQATASPPSVEILLKDLLTIFFFSVMVYVAWLAAHFLVFWFIDKPFSLASYFFIPDAGFSTLPYMLGAWCLISYRFISVLDEAEQALKKLFQGINFLLIVLAEYFSFSLYIRWLSVG